MIQIDFYAVQFHNTQVNSRKWCTVYKAWVLSRNFKLVQIRYINSTNIALAFFPSIFTHNVEMLLFLVHDSKFIHWLCLNLNIF